jgi:hypothetical protein
VTGGFSRRVELHEVSYLEANSKVTLWVLVAYFLYFEETKRGV